MIFQIDEKRVKLWMKFQAAVNVNKIVYSQRRGCSFPSQKVKWELPAKAKTTWTRKQQSLSSKINHLSKIVLSLTFLWQQFTWLFLWHEALESVFTFYNLSGQQNQSKLQDCFFTITNFHWCFNANFHLGRLPLLLWLNCYFPIWDLNDTLCHKKSTFSDRRSNNALSDVIF